MDHNDRASYNRRRFLKWAGGGLLLAALGMKACTPRPSATLPPGVRPSAEPTRRIWRWNIRWIRGTPEVDLPSWRLRIDGMVEEPLELTLEELRALPATTLRLRMKCVECWSAPAVWTGVAGRDLLALVRPLAGTRYVTLHALDGYTSTLLLEELTAGRVLFPYAMDGQDLPADNGFPLRLLAPSKYGYKCVKAVTRLEFVDGPVLGYWESRGYSDEGTIRRGVDQPLDLGETRQIDGGEITEY